MDIKKQLQQKYHAVITTLIPHHEWELAFPQLKNVTFTQTSLVWKRGRKLDSLTDNGTVNSGAAFKNYSHLRFQIKRLMIKYNLNLIKNEYYTRQFPTDNRQQLFISINGFLKFLIKVDRLLKKQI